MAKLKIETQVLDSSELGEWGTFISHSSGSDREIGELCENLDKYGVSYLWDRQIQVGASNFAEEIHAMINKCICAVVIVNEAAMHSQWVNFEIGLLEGLGKRIFLYDKDGLLTDRPYRYHYDKYCPAYKNAAELALAIREEKLFYTLFNNETAELTDLVFRDKVDELVVPVRLRLNLPGLSSIDPKDYKVKALVINFGNFTNVRHNEESVCCQTMDDIENDICEETGCPCCMNVRPDRKKNPECVLLNHTWEKTSVDGDTVEILLPLHKTMGTTVKMFVDCETGEAGDAIHNLLNTLGAESSQAKSGDMNRVYFSLKSSPVNGVFRLKDEFSNNFLCPGIARI